MFLAKNQSVCLAVSYACTYLPSRFPSRFCLVRADSAFETDCSPDVSPFTPIRFGISPRVRPPGCCLTPGPPGATRPCGSSGRRAWPLDEACHPWPARRRRQNVSLDLVSDLLLVAPGEHLPEQAMMFRDLLWGCRILVDLEVEGDPHMACNRLPERQDDLIVRCHADGTVESQICLGDPVKVAMIRRSLHAIDDTVKLRKETGSRRFRCSSLAKGYLLDRVLRGSSWPRARDFG
jgi:hypothetical protein